MPRHRTFSDVVDVGDRVGAASVLRSRLRQVEAPGIGIDSHVLEDGPGEEEDVFGAYPLFATGADGASIPVVTTPGEYKYVGQLSVGFDADGSVAGIYRKMHIPDDPLFYEKFYFTPGDQGFGPIRTRFATLGVGICWDQWFPETARSLALLGAEILFYPTAIGSEPQDPTCDSRDHWQMCMRGHSASNIMPVVASNRTSVPEICGDAALCVDPDDIGALAGAATLKPWFVLLGLGLGHWFDVRFAAGYRQFEQQGAHLGQSPFGQLPQVVQARHVCCAEQSPGGIILQRDRIVCVYREQRYRDCLSMGPG